MVTQRDNIHRESFGPLSGFLDYSVHCCLAEYLELVITSFAAELGIGTGPLNTLSREPCSDTADNYP